MSPRRTMREMDRGTHASCWPRFLYQERKLPNPRCVEALAYQSVRLAMAERESVELLFFRGRICTSVFAAGQLPTKLPTLSPDRISTAGLTIGLGVDRMGLGANVALFGPKQRAEIPG